MEYTERETKTDSPFQVLPVTVGLIAVNILIYIIFNIFLLQNGHDFISLGANSWTEIRTYGEYYRLITSIFLHADIKHLMNNMLILFVIGGRYEACEDKIHFLLIYFIGGVLASLASMAYNMNLGYNISSIGASGAIFALIGGAVAAVIKNHHKLKSLSRTQLIAFTIFSLYAGFKDSYTDNSAHLGGFLAGLIIGLIISSGRKTYNNDYGSDRKL